METDAAESPNGKRDLVLASIFTTLGLVAIVIGKGGISNMIAGSVGSVGAGVMAIFFVASDGRLSYSEKSLASIPVVIMLAVTGFLLKDNVFALAGYPLAALGVFGLVPALRAAQPAPVERAERRAPAAKTRAHAAESGAAETPAAS
jgi:hypothetical protein